MRLIVSIERALPKSLGSSGIKLCLCGTEFRLRSCASSGTTLARKIKKNWEGLGLESKRCCLVCGFPAPL